MNQILRNTLPLAVLCLYSVSFVGCNRGSGPAVATDSQADQDDGHEHDDTHDHEAHQDDGHDADGHDAHAGHNHAEMGANGGHMISLSGGAHAEWVHDDDEELLTIYAEGTVSKVEMKTDIEGTETVYEFKSAEVDGKPAYQLKSPELLTAIKMGDPVKTKLVISTADGESTGMVEHHAH